MRQNIYKGLTIPNILLGPVKTPKSIDSKLQQFTLQESQSKAEIKESREATLGSSNLYDA